MANNLFIVAVEDAWAVLKADILKAGTWLEGLVSQLWAADVQIVMADLNKALAAEAVALQNDQPGMDAKAMFAQLLVIATENFAGLVAQLAYEDVTLTISLVIKSLNISQTPGNGGILPSGIQS